MQLNCTRVTGSISQLTKSLFKSLAKREHSLTAGKQQVLRHRTTAMLLLQGKWRHSASNSRDVSATSQLICWFPFEHQRTCEYFMYIYSYLGKCANVLKLSILMLWSEVATNRKSRTTQSNECLCKKGKLVFMFRKHSTFTGPDFAL